MIMKKFLSIIAFVSLSLAALAQEPSADSVQVYDLQKISRKLYRDYHYKIKNAIDSIIYHSDLDSLNCVVFDNVAINKDGTTIHNVKSNSPDLGINSEIEETVAQIKLPAIAFYDDAGNATPIDATASFSIVSNAHTEKYEYLLNVKGGEVRWLSDVPDVLRGVLDKFASVAFYGNDSGNFRLEFSTFNINTDILAFGTFSLYQLKKKSEKHFISYVGHQFTYFGRPFAKTEEQLEKEKEEREKSAEYVKASFAGKDANAFSTYVTSRLEYPPFAKDRNIQGTVDVYFTLSKTGEVKNIRIDKAVHPTLDREAFRTVSTSPKWTPATKDGEPISIGYKHPVIFLLRYR